MENNINYILHFIFILTNHILKFLNVGFIQNVRISFYNILVYLSAIFCERGKLNFKADRNLVSKLVCGKKAWVSRGGGRERGEEEGCNPKWRRTWRGRRQHQRNSGGVRRRVE